MPDDAPHLVHGAFLGRPTRRIDGRAKVTGRARYASDEPLGNPAWAFLVTSRIARGRVRGLDLSRTRAVPGFLDILTHENAGDEVGPLPPHGPGEETTTLQDDRVWHDGQIIAVVLADSFEAAREAAYKVRVEYEEETPSAGFDSSGVREHRRDPGEHVDFELGDADAAFAAAPVRIDRRYETPTQHHNPIELFTTSCQWQDGSLTVWEPSQFVYGLKSALAKQLKMDPKKVRVVSRFVGGAFGSKGNATGRTAWIAVAARRLGRPVKLVSTRDQGYTIATYRAETRHHIQLGASEDGRLVAVRHEGWEVTSRPSDYNVSGTETTGRMYASPNILTRVNVVHADRNTPGFMRAPPDVPYMFALESAMDELAVELAMDPIELRRRNDAAYDPPTGQRWSSRGLIECFEQGAERFGWRDRAPAPRATRDGDWLIGLGCAAAAYPSNTGAATARVLLGPDGAAAVQIAGHDIGTGAYTLVAMTAADRLGLPIDKITVQMGDTDLPPAGLAAGSSHSAGICNAVFLACEQLRARLAHAAVTSNEGPLAGRQAEQLVLSGGELRAPDGTAEPLPEALARLGAGAAESYAEHVPKGMPPNEAGKLYQGQMVILRGSQRSDVTTYGFGAQFVEVRVNARTGEVRVPRMLGAFSCGRILNPETARSQFMGGMIWGIGSALHEATEIDRRAARYTNDNISEYLIPVNADVRDVEVMMLPEQDSEVNTMGIKGIGEIGIVGVNAAIANAVFHATGRRLRRLPIRVEDLL
jgi:xanthine dehydrogenase YagR molybdenum-binding subunit